MKATNLIIAIVVLAAIAFWYAPAAMWGIKASRLTASLNGEGADPNDFANQLEEVMEGPAPLAWLRGRAEMRGYFGLEEFTEFRTASFSQNIPFKDLLNEGEEMPDPLYYDAYATARAASHLTPNCDILLETIASACKTHISRGHVSTPKSGDVRANIDLNIAYLPKYPMGDPSSIANGKFRSGSVRLKFEDVKDPASNQRLVLERALEICAKLRETYSNCIITRVAFDQNTVRVYKANEKVSEDRLNSRILLTVYANKEKVGRQKIQEAITTINEKLPKLPGQV